MEAQLLGPLQKSSAGLQRDPELHAQATHRLRIVGGNAQNQPVRAAGCVKTPPERAWGVKGNAKKPFAFPKATCLTWRCHGSEPLSGVPLRYRRSSSGLREPTRIWSATLACKGWHRWFCWDPLPVTGPAESPSTKGQLQRVRRHFRRSALCLEGPKAYFACTVEASSQWSQRPQYGRAVVAFDSVERSDAGQRPHPSHVLLQHVSQVTDIEGISVILPWRQTPTHVQHKPVQTVAFH